VTLYSDKRSSWPTFLCLGYGPDVTGLDTGLYKSGWLYSGVAATAQTLAQVGGSYAPAAECGLRWDDTHLGLDWPPSVSTISAKDASWPLLAYQVPRLLSEMAQPAEVHA
jgi:hypothetical protein